MPWLLDSPAMDGSDVQITATIVVVDKRPVGSALKFEVTFAMILEVRFKLERSRRRVAIQLWPRHRLSGNFYYIEDALRFNCSCAERIQS